MKVKYWLFQILIWALFCCIYFPKSAAGQVHDLTTDGESVRIPFESYSDFIIVKGRLFENFEMNFIFDTGAENTLLFHRIYTDIIGVEYDRKIPIYGADVSRKLFALIARHIQLKVPPANTMSMSVLVLEDDYSNIDQMLGIPVHGILGASYFRDYVVEINYRKQYIELHRINHFVPPESDFSKFKINVLNGKPYTSAVVTLVDGSQKKLNFLIDSGAGLPLLIHSNTDPDLTIPDNALNGQLGAGLGGYLHGYIGRLPNLDIWDHNFANVLSSFQDLDSFARDFKELNRQGIIGNQLLSRFHLYINYPTSEIYLKPGKDIREPFEFDKSGLSIVAAGLNLNEYYISHVMENSPAGEAGLRRGDRIVGFQRIPIAFFRLATLNGKLMKREGKKIRIRVERDEERKTFTFRLRELF